MILALNVWVTDPLKKLLRVVKEISQKGTETASLVQIDSRDEIGDLGAAFNGMVIELRESQKKIREYTEELEAKVQESTAGLKQANARLQQDIVERIQTEEALRASEENTGLYWTTPVTVFCWLIWKGICSRRTRK